MSDRIRSRLTFANVVSLIALFIALGGGAYAVSKGKVRKIADKEIDKKAPGLSVANATSATNATNADALGGQGPSAFQTGAATASASNTQNLLAGLPAQTVLSTTITLPSTRTVTANAAVTGNSFGGDDMFCNLSIAGVDGVTNGATFHGTDANGATVALTQSRTLGAGTHTVLAECYRAGTDGVSVQDRALTAVATG